MSNSAPIYNEDDFGLHSDPKDVPFPEKGYVWQRRERRGQWHPLYWHRVINHIESVSEQFIFPHPPPIVYARFPDGESERTDDDKLYELDYLGRYFPGNDANTGCILDKRDGRRIEIYKPRISLCAKRLGVEEKELELVVVIHEIMHALLHLGCAPRSEMLPDLDLQVFLKDRLDHWNELSGTNTPSRVLELHAQLGSWHILRPHHAVRTAGLVKVFRELMQHQPEEYRVSDKLLNTAPCALWAWSCHARRHYPEDICTSEAMEGFLLKGIDYGDGSEGLLALSGIFFNEDGL